MEEVQQNAKKISEKRVNKFGFLIFVSVVILFLIKTQNAKIEGYTFIDPETAELEVEKFLEKQEKYRLFYTPLREEIEVIAKRDPEIRVGVYFEDLNSRGWIGINEREKFIPASLLKTSTAVAVLKMIEENEIDIQKEVKIKDDDLNQRFGSLYEHLGETYTIKELIEMSLKDSDNTATKALRDFIPEERLIEARLAMGLPISVVTTSSIGAPLSPKEYSNIFKSLYASNYLSRESSNYLLSIMSQTDLSYGLREGVPEEIIVSHKIGIYGTDRSLHDCGIVYAKNPYILCVMTQSEKVWKSQ